MFMTQADIPPREGFGTAKLFVGMARNDVTIVSNYFKLLHLSVTQVIQIFP